MNPNVASTASNHLLTSTATGGMLTVISQNSSAITVIIVAITGIASIWLNYRNTKANEERNMVNKRNITHEIIKSLKDKGLSDTAHEVEDAIL